jgi:ketosteroid isomerase-like protein
MRRTPAVLLAACALAAGAAALHASTAERPAKPEDLVRMECDWARATVARDAEAIGRMVAEDFFVIYPDGTTGDRAMELEGMTAGVVEFRSFTIHEATPRLYGDDTGVVTGRSTIAGTAMGTDISGTYRWTDVWIRDDGRWQVVSAQITRVAEPGENTANVCASM